MCYPQLSTAPLIRGENGPRLLQLVANAPFFPLRHIWSLPPLAAFTWRLGLSDFPRRFRSRRPITHRGESIAAPPDAEKYGFGGSVRRKLFPLLPSVSLDGHFVCFPIA